MRVRERVAIRDALGGGAAAFCAVSFDPLFPVGSGETFEGAAKFFSFARLLWWSDFVLRGVTRQVKAQISLLG